MNASKNAQSLLRFRRPVWYGRRDQQSSRSVFHSQPKAYGCYGLQDLGDARDFGLLADRAILRCEKLKLALYQKDQQHNTQEVLFLLDSISNEVCSVIDVAELSRNTHGNEQFRRWAEETFFKLSTYIHGLNSNKKLYSLLETIVEDESYWKSMSAEEKIFAVDLKSEFESDGIHLPDNEKSHLVQKQGEIVETETLYMQQEVQGDAIFDLLLSDEDQVGVIRDWMKQYISKQEIDAIGTIQCSNAVRCTTNKRVLGGLIRSLREESDREQVWRNMATQPAANVETLGKLIQYRQSLAQQQGYSSYAHKFLKNKAAKSPEAVTAMLESLSTAVRAKAESELELLWRLKESLREPSRGTSWSKKYGMDSDVSLATPGAREFYDSKTALRPWDIAYLTAAYQAQISSAGSRRSNQQAISSASAYLPLERCLNGLALLCAELFGVTLRRVPIRDNEGWVYATEDNGSGPAAPGGRPLVGHAAERAGLYKLEVVGPNGDPMGVVFLDLYQRKNKFTGSAHFTVRCGCKERNHGLYAEEMEDGDYEARSADRSHRTGVGAGDGVKLGQAMGEGHGGYQLPIVVLVLNLSGGTSGSGPTLLSLQEVETLHHEWGHALHSLLSRTTFQHLSGTRGALDFAEVPSHLFEYFARTPEVLRQWAGHWQTGLPPPAGLLEEALAAKADFAAVELQTQILYSAVDQHIFGPGIGPVGHLQPTEVYGHALRGMCELQQALTVLPLAPAALAPPAAGRAFGSLPAMPWPAMLPLSHNHFINYGAGYYSYLFARLYAAQIWETRFASDPLSRESGRLVWHNMLRFGASKDTGEMLSDLAGGSLDPAHFLKTIL